jgi:hypothetical protein
MEIIILGEIMWYYVSEKDKYHIFSLLCGIYILKKE